MSGPRPWAVTVGDRAAARYTGKGRGSRGDRAIIYVRASSRESAIQTAKVNNVHRGLRIILAAREATPSELGCVSTEQARAMAAEMRASVTAKAGQS